jgi:hypothetical protein
LTPTAPLVLTEAQKKLESVNAKWEKVQVDCATLRSQVQDCDSPESCGVASIALQKCVSSIVCPTAALDFETCSRNYREKLKTTNATTTDEEAAVTQAYTRMEQCLHDFKLESIKLMKGSENDN